MVRATSTASHLSRSAGARGDRVAGVSGTRCNRAEPQRKYAVLTGVRPSQRLSGCVRSRASSLWTAGDSVALVDRREFSCNAPNRDEPWIQQAGHPLISLDGIVSGAANE